MSPRPEIPVGEHGSFSYEHLSSKPPRYKARTYYRDADGVRRRVSANGQSKKAAREALEAMLAARKLATGVGLTSDTRVKDLAAQWLESVERSSLALSTKQQYTDAANRYVIPNLGQLRIREVTTAVCDRAIGRIIDKHGPGAAKSARSAMNGMFGLAVRHDAASLNPVRETRRIPRRPRIPQALTVEQQDDVIDKMRADQRAVSLDLPDLIEFLGATGCRIGEALACRYEDVDWDAGTIEITGTVTRIRGQGLLRTKTKTNTSWRVLKLPGWVLEMLRRRQGELRLNSAGVIFPSPKAGTLRDPHNVGGDIRDLRVRIGYPTLTSHVFRKTVATRLDEAPGVTARDIANQLGHARPSMTQDVYMGRRAVNDAAARILER